MDVGLTGGDHTAIGAQFGKYRVVRRLGEGAFGADNQTVSIDYFQVTGV